MSDLLYIIGWVCLTAGALFVLIAAIGLHRMPDFFTRLHPAGMHDAVALPLVLIGLMLLLPFGVVWVKVVLLILFSLMTSATACHALAKAAFKETYAEPKDASRH